jgi:peroxiredoxin/uncharacterized membrane protein YphA (DoxX/SURF4 family)
MDVSLLFFRLILAAVFSVAGVAKLFDQKNSIKAINDFGAPQSLAKLLGIVLPVAEIATAILLLPLATAWIGAIGALILLLIFVGGIVYNMARGNAPDCHCFGQIYSEPIGWPVLIRNLILTALAIFVVGLGRQNPGMSAFNWLVALSIGERMQLVLGISIIAILVDIWVQLRKMLLGQIVLQRQIEFLGLSNDENNEIKQVERENTVPPKIGLPVGAIVPDFETTDINGKRTTFEHLLMRGKPILMLFASATCTPCETLLPSIEKWRAEVNDYLTIAFVSTGTATGNKEKFGKNNNANTILNQKEKEISSLFRADWTPSAVLINADGTIASTLAIGDFEIHKLFDKTKSALFAATNGNGNRINHNFYFLSPDKLTTDAPRAGQPAPNFTLPTLDNSKNISLSDFRGLRTFILIWRATCPHCQNILADFNKWEAEQQDFNILVVAADEPEAVLANEFRSTVVLERDLELNKKLDNNSAPAALIIDETGKIASDIAKGADEIFALAGYHPDKH